MKVNRILLDPGSGEGGGNTFLATLPTELQKEPALQSFKDVGALAKSHIEAQKLIGMKRIALPGEKASDTEWDAFYNQIGRPDTADKYDTVELKDEKGNVLMKPDEKELGELKKFFHKMGLSGRQARMMQEYSLGYLHKMGTAEATAKQTASEAQVNSLKQEWGDKFGANVDVAKAVIKKFGGQDADGIAKFLDESGLGNNVPLIKLLHSIGMSVQEDTSRRGTGDGLPVSDNTRAISEIELLKGDKEFQTALGNPSHPGHSAAINRWINLFKVAYPGTEAGE